MADDLVPSLVRPDYRSEIQTFERGLLQQLSALGLPSEGILVPVSERATVFGNVLVVLEKLPAEIKGESIYISKFLAAVASGLFDAALNYLWDETIHQLRRRVANYDVSYFYDNAVANNSDKRKRLKDEDDLDKLDDSELILGARQTELITDIGYRHLDYIRYMRNWASAAHPNQNALTGLQIITWLETCIVEVISQPMTQVAAEIRRFLFNIRENAITQADARESAAFFVHLTQDQATNLASGLFGIYTRTEATAQTLANINYVLPLLWPQVDEATRGNFGVRFGKFAANNDQAEKGLARRFLELVNGQAYIPDDLRTVDVENAVGDLLTAHRNLNNFYTEPPFARQLSRLVAQGTSIPKQVRISYAIGLVDVFLTNGHGICHAADPIYASMIRAFTPQLALVAITSFTRPHIASKLQFDRCRGKYLEMLNLIEPSVTSPPVREFIQDVRDYKGPLERLGDDSRIRRRLDAVKLMVN